jgi:uncharacterized RDD family membrane protein YckC
MVLIKRGIAFFIDFILIVLLHWGYCALFAHRVGPRHYDHVPGGLWALYVLFTVYYILMEYRFQQTFGKILLGFLVVRQDGTKPSLIDTIKRNILSFVELVLIPPIAVGFAAANKGRRLGDLIAHTEVLPYPSKVLPLSLKVETP